MIKVYLSGGMKSEWRTIVKAHIDAHWIDPAEHGLSYSEEYTAWDLLGIRACDVLFAYLEEENPSGLGLMLEIGYAKALNKLVIFVDGKSDTRYTKIGQCTADCVYSELEDGISMLKHLERIYKSG